MSKTLSVIIMNKVLNEKSTEVSEESFGAELDNYMSDMAEIMYAHSGIGLSGVQVGRLERVLVADLGYAKGVGYGKEHIKMVNPRVINMGTDNEVATEGCLSYPGLQKSVARPKSVIIEFYSPFGERSECLFEGNVARIILHEIDHFDGVTLYNRASSVAQKRYDKKLIKQLITLSNKLKAQTGI